MCRLNPIAFLIFVISYTYNSVHTLFESEAIMKHIASDVHATYNNSSSNRLSSRVFMNGNSQAVRIPQEFRFDTKQVEIYRNSDGDLVLHAVTSAPVNRGAALLKVLNAFDDDFVATLEAQHREQPSVQDRESF